MTTATELAKILNHFRTAAGLSEVKATSYPKSKMEAMIAEFRRLNAESNDSNFITLAEIASSLGIRAKTARARYRKYFNDKVRTFYKFDRTVDEINRVTKIIS